MRVIFPFRDPDTQYTGAMTISSVLKERGHQVFGVEAKMEILRPYLADGRQAVVAFSAPTAFLLGYLKLARMVKREYPESFIIFGGWHPTYSPEMIELDEVDAICIGEGEWAMVELCEQLDADAHPTGIQNLWIKGRDGSIEKNPNRPLIQNLDDLPQPDRNFMVSGQPEYYYIIASVVTQRSCPFACSFCVNNAFNQLYRGQKPHKRRRSVDHVISELEEIKAHGKLEFVKFEDSIFTLHPVWIREFSRKYRHRINVPFTCFVRAEVATPQMIKDIKEAGAVSVSLGVEVGDEKLRQEVFNKKISDEMLKKAVRIIKAEGLKVKTHNILGLPGCGIETDLKTLRLNADLKPDYAASGFLQPYPGTDIYNRYRKEGLIPLDLNKYLRAIPDSYIEPSLPFPDDQSRLQARNLQRLFAITVNFPFLYRLTRKVINFPITRFYRLLYGGWKSFAYFFKIWPISPKQLKILIKRAGRMAS